MLAKFLNTFWKDEAGYMVSSELVMLSTVGVLGTAVGFNFMQAEETESAAEKRKARREARNQENENRRDPASRSVDRELRDVGNAIGRINQSYYYHGASGFRGANGIPKAATAGSFFIDYAEEAASDEERAERREAERRMFSHHNHGVDHGGHPHDRNEDGFGSGFHHFHQGGRIHHRGRDHHRRPQHGPHHHGKGHDHDAKHDHKHDDHDHNHGDDHKHDHKAQDTDAKKHGDKKDQPHDAHRKGDHPKGAHGRGHHDRPAHGHHARGPHRGHHHPHGQAWGGVSTASWNRAYAAGRRAAIGTGHGIAGRYGFGAAYDDFCGTLDSCGCGASYQYDRVLRGYGFGSTYGASHRSGRGYRGYGFGAGYGSDDFCGGGGSSYRRFVFRSVRPVCDVAAFEARAAAVDAIIAKMNEPKIFKNTDDCVPPAPAGRTFIAPEAINPPLYYLPSFDYPAPMTYPPGAIYGW